MEPYFHALFHCPLFFCSIHNLNEILFAKDNNRTTSMKKNMKTISFLSENFAFLRHENFIKMNLRVFIFVYHNVLCLRWVSRPIRRLLKWKGRVCELLAILKGDMVLKSIPTKHSGFISPST